MSIKTSHYAVFLNRESKMPSLRKKTDNSGKDTREDIHQNASNIKKYASQKKSKRKIKNPDIEVNPENKVSDSQDKSSDEIQQGLNIPEINEKGFRSLIENSNDVIELIDADGFISYVSPSIVKVLGYREDERTGHNVFENIHPDDIPRIRTYFNQLIQTPELVINETLRYRHKNGEWRWLEGYARNLLDEPTVKSIVIDFRDVSKHKKTEQRLQENERRLLTLMGNLPGMAYRCLNNPDWPMEFISTGCFELTGYQPEQFTSCQINYNDIIHPDDQERIWNEVQIAVEKRERFQFEYRIKTNKGKIKWVWEQGCAIYDDAGNVQVLEGFITDISDRIQIQENEQLLANIIAQTDDAVLVTSPDGIIEYVNPSFERITGYSSDNVKGKKPNILKSGRHSKTFYRDLWKTILKGESFSDVFINRRKNRDIYYEQKTITPLVNRDGKITHFVSTAKDITGQKRIEIERSRFLNILEASLNEIYIFNTETLKFEYINACALKNLGYDSEQIMTMTAVDLKPEYTETTFREFIKPLLQHEQEKLIFYTEHRRADGSLYPVEVHLQLVELEDESVFLAVIIDITEQKQVEKALRESESKLIEAQQMAHLGYWYWDVKSGEVDWSDEVYWIFRRDPNEFVPKIDSIMALSPWEEDNKRHKEVLSRAMESHEQGEFEQRFLRPDGSTGYYFSTFKGIYNDNNEVIAVKGTVQDITERKLAEQHLALLDFALNHASEATYLIDKDACFLNINDEACRALGYSRDELLNMKVTDIDPSFSMEDWYNHWNQLKIKKSITIETVCQHKEGHIFPVEVNTNYFKFEGQEYNMAFARDITERKLAESTIRESEERYRIITRATNDVVWDWDLSQDSIWMSDNFNTVFGYDTDNIHFDINEWINHLHPDDKEETLNSIDQLIKSDQQKWSGEYRFRRADGSYAYIYDRCYVMHNPDGKPVRMIGAMSDITDRKEAQDKILRLNRVYKMLSAINSLIVHVKSRQELFNEACRIAVVDGEFLLAWISDIDEQTNKVRPVARFGDDDGYLNELNISLDSNDPGGRGPTANAIRNQAPFICNDIESDPCMEYWKERALKRGFRSAASIPLLTSNKIVGTINLYAKETNFFNDEEMKLLKEVATDISYAFHNIVQKETLDYLASFDPLTGLANRTLFHDHLNSVLKRAEKNKKSVALLVCDPKQFRNINNVYGRDAGDQILQEIAKRLRELTSDPVNLGRISGDYFAMILHDVKDSTGIAYMFENTLFPMLNKPFLIQNNEIPIKFSGGIAVFPSDGTDAETLYRNAEAASKKATSVGEQYLFYQPEMTARISETLHTENRLRTALKENQFVLHYQPKIDSISHKIIGLEALIRWEDPETGLVPPGKFIPILEETGLILDVGIWALDRAASDYRHWLTKLKNVPRIAVNVSALQLKQKDFADQVEKAISRGGKPVPMDIEITESMIMTDIEYNISKLKAIRMAGFGIAVDDFGTGYSSLSYIAKLPINSLKIDRSFITNMTTRPESMTIVSIIITLAHSLNLNVIAEGVETEEQAKFLSLLKCNEMQGYLFSKPLPPDEIYELLRSEKRL